MKSTKSKSAKKNKSNVKAKAAKVEGRGVGRPKFELTYPRGAFTVKDLAAANPKVCTLTVRKHIEEQLAGKFLTQLAETVKTGKVGKPAFRYIRSAVVAGRKAAKATKPATAEAPATPAVEVPVTETPAPTVVETPAVAVTAEAPVATPAA